MKPNAEITRLKYKYRKLIMEGKLKLPHQVAAKLIGPDCAYHLYSQYQTATKNQPGNCNQSENQETY